MQNIRNQELGVIRVSSYQDRQRAQYPTRVLIRVHRMRMRRSLGGSSGSLTSTRQSLELIPNTTKEETKKTDLEKRSVIST